ncbi:MAG: hypothetical protein LBM16_02415 [Clostridiales bacterium]|nr:hypothetical protein [Clostridiales bacterium]
MESRLLQTEDNYKTVVAFPSANVIFFVSFFFKKKEMGCGATLRDLSL